MADATEKARLLSILENHGQSFLDSFAPIGNSSRKRTAEAVVKHVKRRRSEPDEDNEEEEENQEREQEWYGISKDITQVVSDSSADDADDSGSDFEHSDDEFTTAEVERNVVVFSDPSIKRRSEVDYVSKAQMRAFMSSKIAKVSSNVSDPVVAKQKLAEEEDDRTNAQNDAMLHKLVHTKLLSGSTNTELDLTPAQRRKALAGRILELTGEAKLGKGGRMIRDAEKRKAAKRVREGLADKQKERNLQELEEAKNLGNYHPTLKKVFEASGTSSAPRKRVKGLKMGVGNFRNGSLRLSRDDVNMALDTRRESSSRGGRSKGRGRPGKRK